MPLSEQELAHRLGRRCARWLSGFIVREYAPIAWIWLTMREPFGGHNAKIVHVTFDSTTDRFGQFDQWDADCPSFWLRACHVVEELTSSPF
jgi:hypothetical protein